MRKTAEIVILRHQLSVLQPRTPRRPHGPQVAPSIATRTVLIVAAVAAPSAGQRPGAVGARLAALQHPRRVSGDPGPAASTRRQPI